MDGNTTTMSGEMMYEEDWMRTFYAPVADSDHTIVGIILICLTTLGLVGNLTCIYIFLTTRSLRTPSNILLLNLALTDLFMCVSCQPLMMISSFKREWLFGKLGCDIYGAMTSMGGIGSIMGLCAIAYDRYIMICFATEASRIASTARSVRIAVMVWLYSSMYAILPALGIGGFLMDGFKTSCTYDYVTRDLSTRTFIVFMYITAFAAPVTLNIYFYYNIYDTVRSSGASDKKEKKQQNKELKIAKIGIICMVFFLIAWVPYVTIAFIGQFQGPGFITPRLSTLPALFAKSACVYNAYIYGFMHPKYQYQIKKRFFCFATPTEGSTTAASAVSQAK